MKEEKVVNFYVLCNKLKNVIRKGWLDWHVASPRLESVAEHIYGTQMLALAMKSEYSYDIDIMKVIYMLAIHELGETIIGDLTLFDIGNEEKAIIEHRAVHEILAPLLDAKMIEDLFLEFDAHETKEALFAFMCDKLECDIQCKLYDENNYVDLTNQKDNKTVSNELITELLSTGRTWSDMWLSFGEIRYPYDENFMRVSKYVKDNNISEFHKKELIKERKK